MRQYHNINDVQNEFSFENSPDETNETVKGKVLTFSQNVAHLEDEEG